MIISPPKTQRSILVDASLRLWGAEESVPISPKRAPIGSEKAPSRPEKARFSRKDFVSAGPKCGCLNVGAWNSQESGRKAPLSCSFSNVALQFLACCSAAFDKNDFRTAEKRMLQCNFCSATFRKLQRNFCFRLWHVAGVGFRGVGLRTCWSFAVISPTKTQKLVLKDPAFVV